MKNKTIVIMLTALLLASAGSGANVVQRDSGLQIYLLREVTLEGDVPTLGQVAVIRGEESLVAKAEEIKLGRISSPGQQIIVDRAIVLSRLASSGISASAVTLTGAKQIAVTQKHQIIQGDEFVEKALAFLKKNPPQASICQWNPVRIPKNLILPGADKDIRLSVSLVKSGARNQAKVRIAVFSGEKEIGSREVTVRLRYDCRRLVTQVDIERGTIIRSENLKVEQVVSNYPEPANWTGLSFCNISQNGVPILPQDLIARRRLPVNTVIRPGMIGPAKPKVLFKRNQSVLIKVERLGLLITAIGKAKQDGHLGEYVKVQNVDSKRIILAKVNEDGSVEPVF